LAGYGGDIGGGREDNLIATRMRHYESSTAVDETQIYLNSEY